jgi:hypothetical protein
VGFNERIVDSNDIDVIVLNGISEDNTTNAAETVDSNLDRHDCLGVLADGCCSGMLAEQTSHSCDKLRIDSIGVGRGGGK